MQAFRPNGFLGLTPVIKNLLIINVIMFVLLHLIQLPNIDLLHLLSLHYPKSELFMPHQFVTYMFLHGGFLHLFGNMFALWMFGNVLERVWGSKRFLTYYLITGIGAAVIHLGYTTWEFSRINDAFNAFMASPDPDGFLMLLKEHFNGGYREDVVLNLYNQWSENPNQPGYTENAAYVIQALYQEKMNIPTLGASGSVFGILAAFGLLFPNTELMMLFFPVPIKAKYFVLLYAGFELYAGIQANPGDNVAHFAHLGGALFGFILVKIWSRDRNQFY